MALSKSYSWYIENGQIAVVEPSTDTDSNLWTAISTADKTVRVYARRFATDFDTTLTDDNKTINLPNRFRRTISDLAISKGYEIPPNVSLELAGHFYNKYKTKLREMKKVKNANYQRGGTISAWYY